MNKRKRLILVVIFAVAAGVIISTKINSSTQTPIKDKITGQIFEVQKKITNTPNDIKNTLNKKNTNNISIPVNTKDNKPSNYLTLIPECLSIKLENNISLKKISNKQRWMNKDPKNLIRQNLIYKNGLKELRISITPSENKKNWTLQSFDVDSDDMPISKNKLMGLRYDQLANKIKSAKEGFSLISDEQNILVDTPEYSGSILFINDDPTEIKLFNKKNQRLLECQGTYCICNQALSS